MRPLLPVVLALALLLPAALATHPVQRDLADEVHKDAAIYLVVEASGTVRASAAGRETRPSAVETASHDYTWSYRWGGTIELHLDTRGVLQGDAHLTGWGRGHVADQWKLDVKDGETSTMDRACPLEVDVAGGLTKGEFPVRGAMDETTGMLLLHLGQIGFVFDPAEKACTTTSDNGHTEQSALYPPPTLSPVPTEGDALFASRGDVFSRIQPGLDRENARRGVTFEVPLSAGHSIVRGGAGVSYPMAGGSPPPFYCVFMSNQQMLRGSCSQSGTLNVRVIVDPCPTVRESHAEHLADVKAIAAPPKGSSESQARAFQVDVRQKVTALLADERVLQLVCGEDGTDLTPIADAAAKVVETWADVLRTHGLSDQGKRDLLSAERALQLVGGTSSASASAVSDVLSSPGQYGAIKASVHSPVALHAWSADGRHVGWNATTGQVDLQIEGATYEGAPGGAQTLTVPSDAYKIVVEELAEGSYTLNLAWNGTGGEGVEMIPLASTEDRTLVMNAMLDQHGMLLAPAQRVPTETTSAATFVEPWRPLKTEPLFAPRDAGAEDAEGGEGTKKSPGAGLAALVGVAVVVALAVTRRRR